MKKLGSLLLVLLLAFALTACDSIPKDSGGSSNDSSSGTSGDSDNSGDSSSGSGSGNKDVYSEDGFISLTSQSTARIPRRIITATRQPRRDISSWL